MIKTEKAHKIASFEIANDNIFFTAPEIDISNIPRDKMKKIRLLLQGLNSATKKVLKDIADFAN